MERLLEGCSANIGFQPTSQSQQPSIKFHLQGNPHVKLAKEDPSLNLCDFYLFEGHPGTTVMAMTVNPDVGVSASEALHPEGLYAFRFDLNSDYHSRVFEQMKEI